MQPGALIHNVGCCESPAAPPRSAGHKDFVLTVRMRGSRADAQALADLLGEAGDVIVYVKEEKR